MSGFHPAEASLSQGEDYALISGENGNVNKICWGTVTRLERPHRLDYTFTVKPLGGQFTDVSWTLEACGTGTKLTLVHSGLDAGAEAFGLLQALDKGWDEHMSAMREALK